MFYKLFYYNNIKTMFYKLFYYNNINHLLNYNYIIH